MEDLINEINSLREKHREQTIVHSQLLTQQNESTAALNVTRILEFMVQEIKLVEEDTKIFKATGPILTSQTKEEAVSTISKRLEYINTEIETVDKSITTLQSKIEEKCKKLEALKAKNTPTVPAST